MPKNSLENFSMTIIEIAWRVILILVAIYAIMVGVQRAYRYGYETLYDHAMEASPGTDVNLDIVEGEGAEEVADRLLELGLIDNTRAFAVQADLYNTTFVSGSYVLNTSMKLSEILISLNEEGKKLSELKDRNLISETTGETETEEDEDIIGGNEDVEDDLEAEEMEIIGGGDEAA